ncbi:hypothetical protein K504DRAFT_536169 [Pleomassaria siparia CBS 279.74]|uniref:Uncharacterized protein n=1 Tax=Pleomassaria siparia CBS 279.74 TaxID=1314801 RepID=A0A6G1K2R5_9PLEO|nr:hypothetical protein K504DRAFT_536169 [Pleomassaria siparia CBS 279.74]
MNASPRPSIRPSSNQYTPTQSPQPFIETAEEARAVLTHLLDTLKKPGNKYHERYGAWIDAQTGLEDFLFRHIRPEVWRCLWTGCRKLDALKMVGGDIKSEGRGIYFDGVLGLDRTVRIYIGQSTHLRSRIAQHWNFRYRRDNPSLHYHAMQNSIYNTFGILAVLPSATPGNQNHKLPGMDCPDLVLNILEMWMCLLFQSLPPQLLEEWLPTEAGKEWRGKDPMALNIACPLDNGSKGQRKWLDLSASEDPLVKEYLANGDRKKSEIEYTQRQVRQVQASPQQNRYPPRNHQAYDPEPTISSGVVLFSVCALAAVLIFTSLKTGGPTPRPKGWRW